jgi:L-galactose dehydrogenase
MQNSLPETYTVGFHCLQAVQRMKYRPLGYTGMNVSVLSLGGSALGEDESNQLECNETVEYAVKNGINYIDVAPWYGHGKAENVLGKALQKIPRSAYYISTKCVRYNPGQLVMFDFSKERVLRSVDESLARLGLQYIDIMKIHDPEFCPSIEIILKETLPALKEAKKQGKIKFIGMTGYPLEFVKEVILRSEVKIDTCLTYCHFSLNDTTLLDFIPFFKEHGIGLMNAAPLSMGLLTPRGPPIWHPAHNHIKQAAAAAVKYCEKKSVDIAKLAIVFSLSHPDIPTTLVGTAKKNEIAANIAAVYGLLSLHEHLTLNYIRDTYFEPLAGKETWTDVEVSKYWRKIGKLSVIRSMYDYDKYSKL